MDRFCDSDWFSRLSGDLQSSELHIMLLSIFNFLRHVFSNNEASFSVNVKPENVFRSSLSLEQSSAGEAMRRSWSKSSGLELTKDTFTFLNWLKTLSLSPDWLKTLLLLVHWSILLFLRIFDRDGDKSVSRGEMKGIVENLFHLIAESRREDKSPKEVRETQHFFSEDIPKCSPQIFFVWFVFNFLTLNNLWVHRWPRLWCWRWTGTLMAASLRRSWSLFLFLPGVKNLLTQFILLTIAVYFQTTPSS